jgi:hypothetical protein
MTSPPANIAQYARNVIASVNWTRLEFLCDISEESFCYCTEVNEYYTDPEKGIYRILSDARFLRQTVNRGVRTVTANYRRNKIQERIAEVGPRAPIEL